MAYDISALAKRTGVSVSTIRAWEARYRLVEPTRSSGGHRVYSTRDAERVALFKELMDLGRRPRDLAALSNEELARLRAAAPAEPLMFGQLTTALERAMRQRDRGTFQRTLVAAFAILPPIESVGLYSLCLQTIGRLWEEGEFTVADEHIFSFNARNVIIAATQARPTLVEPPRIGFATCEGEHHEHGLLAGAFLASCAGMQAVYYGPSVPTLHLAQAAREDGLRALLISIVHVEDTHHVVHQVHELVRSLGSEIQLWVACAHHIGHAFAPVTQVSLLHTYAELRAKLALLR